VPVAACSDHAQNIEPAALGCYFQLKKFFFIDHFASSDIRYCFNYAFDEGDALALITRDGTWLYTDRRYYSDVVGSVRDMHVIPVGITEGYLSRLNNVCLSHGIERLGFNERMPYEDYAACKSALSAKLVPAAELIEGLRSIKDEDELELISIAQGITDKVFRGVLPYIKEGVTERELSARITTLALENGAEGLPFRPLVQSGPNTALPHKRPTDRPFRESDLITVDFGVTVGGYSTDFARTVSLGRPDAEIRALYSAVLKAQTEGIEAMKPMVRQSLADYAARASLDESGYDPDFSHSFAHGIGLDAQEAPYAEPYSTQVFRQGMVMSAEPAVYIEGKYGVRIEDPIIIGKDVNEFLSGITRELIVL